MNQYNFHNEIAYNLKMFEAAFDDTIIKRFDDVTQTFRDSIKVNYVFAPKSRILNDLINKTDNVKLPIVAISIKGMGRDNTRVKNKLEEFVYKKSDGSYVNFRKIPWNISVDMTIMTKYVGDLDQIIQNFAVYTDPYIVYSWQEPITKLEVRTEVLWDENISIEYPIDLNTTQLYRNVATTSFTIKTWLYRSALTPVKKICTINTDYVLTNNFYCNYESLTADTENNYTESYTISGKPILRYVSPYYIKDGDTTGITLEGYNFNTVESVYISANNNMFTHTEYDLLSTGTPTFKGLLIDEFTKSENTLTFNIPPLTGQGLIDIIAVNACSYSKLTTDADRTGRSENPYPVYDPEHYRWTAIQYPFINGLIKV